MLTGKIILQSPWHNSQSHSIIQVTSFQYASFVLMWSKQFPLNVHSPFYTSYTTQDTFTSPFCGNVPNVWWWESRINNLGKYMRKTFWETLTHTNTRKATNATLKTHTQTEETRLVTGGTLAETLWVRCKHWTITHWRRSSETLMGLMGEGDKDKNTRMSETRNKKIQTQNIRQGQREHTTN